MSLGENIKQARNAKTMTQAQLAEALRVSPQAVSKWETSETYPDGSMLVPLANLLGISLDTLFDNKMETCAALPDVAERIGALIKATPYPDRMDLARELCWQIERGLFRFGCSGKYTPATLKNTAGYPPSSATTTASRQCPTAKRRSLRSFRMTAGAGARSSATARRCERYFHVFPTPTRCARCFIFTEKPKILYSTRAFSRANAA